MRARALSRPSRIACRNENATSASIGVTWPALELGPVSNECPAAATQREPHRVTTQRGIVGGQRDELSMLVCNVSRILLELENVLPSKKPLHASSLPRCGHSQPPVTEVIDGRQTVASIRAKDRQPSRALRRQERQSDRIIVVRARRDQLTHGRPRERGRTSARPGLSSDPGRHAGSAAPRPAWCGRRAPSIRPEWRQPPRRW